MTHPTPPNSAAELPEALYSDAVKFAKEKASISYVQRKCRCSYNDAERMLERMVSDGIITTYQFRKEGAIASVQPALQLDVPETLGVYCGLSPDDVTDPTHPRYVAGFKAGHLAGRKNAAPQQEVQEPAIDGDILLRLPILPTPDAPANTAGLIWDAYSGFQMLAYGRACSDATLAARAAPQPAPSIGAEGVAYAGLQHTLWVLAEHNALHFGENHSTVMQAHQALAALAAQNGGAT